MSAHKKKHGISATADHTGVGGATSGNFIEFDANGLPTTGGNSNASSFDAAGTATSTLSTHNSTYDHTKLHDQNTDTKLDEGGANEVAASTIKSHHDSTSNPHAVTKTQVGLGNVDDLQQIPLTQKGAANGVCPLGADSKVPSAYIPQGGGLDYQSAWNADTNTPALTSSTGTKGYYYVVSVAGSTSLDGESDWKEKDWAVFNGTVWEKVDNTDGVTSVNGQVGVVVLDTDDVSEATNEYYTEGKVSANTDVAANTAARHTQGTDTTLATDKVTVNASTGDTTVVGELKIQVYQQASEPTLNADQFMAIWEDTDDGNATYLIYRRGSGDNVLVELS